MGYEIQPMIVVLLIFHFPHIYYLKLKWPFSNPTFAYNRTPDLLWNIPSSSVDIVYISLYFSARDLWVDYEWSFYLDFVFVGSQNGGKKYSMLVKRLNIILELSIFYNELSFS